MGKVQRALAIAFAFVVVSSAAVIYANASLADPDLRYPVVLLTKLAGGLGAVFFLGRAAVLFVKLRVLARAPGAAQGLQTLLGMLAMAVGSAMSCILGASLMVTKSGALTYWPLPIVLVFGGLGAFSTRYLWREWQTHRRLGSKS
jgi:hypothetical protein